MNITPPSRPLTPREIEILRLIAEGLTDHQIAATLKVTVHTSNAYRKSLLHKLGATNAASLVRIAIERKILHLRPD